VPRTRPLMNPSRTKLPAWPRCKASWQTSNNSAWPLASGPQATSTPPCSTSTCPTIAEEEVEIKTAAGTAEANNNQPGMVLAGRAHHNPHVRPLLSSA
jgi:hypothetical protein